MIVRFFIRLTSIPFFKRLLWPIIYNFLARRLPESDWQFMNYGFSLLPDSPEQPLSLGPEYEFQRYPLQMYHYLAMMGPIDNKHVLEVGSGRGGGANYLYKFHNPASYTGIDCSNVAVDFSRKHFKGEHLHFEVGDAEQLPFEDEKFNILINIESSRHYGSFPNFLKEVQRVLKPGGRLLLADLRMTDEIASFRKMLKISDMTLISEEEITRNVLASLDKFHQTYHAQIKEQIPRYFRRYFAEFSAVKGTSVYADFQKRKRQYFRIILEKN